MADCGFNTAEFPLEESKERLRRFQAAVAALIDENELHQMTFVASVGVADGQGGSVSIGDHYGCVSHAVVYMARFLANALDHNGIAWFLNLMKAEVANRHERETAQLQQSTAEAPPPTETAPVETGPTKEDLLNMPLPNWAQKKVQ